MSVTTDILATYRNPQQVMRRQLGGGVREDRALVYLIVACFLIFVAQFPRLSREAYLDPSVPLDMRMGSTLLAWLFIAPLVFYAIAALSHLVAKLFGGQGSFFSARLALFWSLLTISPLWLFYGLLAGFVGPGSALSVVGAGVLLTFGVLWAVTLTVAERAALDQLRPTSGKGK